MSRRGFTRRNVNAVKNQRTFVLILVIATIVIDHDRAVGDELDVRVPRTDAGRLSESFRRVAEQVLPAVVTIETMNGPRKTRQWEMREMSLRHRSDASTMDHSDGSRGRASYGTGSGIIIDRRGYILTCHHVIESADTILIYLSDGRRFHPASVWTDPRTDLAVIRIEGAGDLAEAKLGDSETLRVGDWVVSVGDPYGLGISVSAGVVSAINRQSPDGSSTRLIQTDAATNPGNSGGALINLSGEVVGISEGGYGLSAGFQGIGFAIPVNVADRIARKLMDNGHIRRAYLGCHTNSISAAVARHIGLAEKRGVIVSDVTAKTPADTAGIRIGDVLTHFSGSVVDDPYHFQQMIDQAEPDHQYEVTIVRGSLHLKVQVRLELLHENDEFDRGFSPHQTGHSRQRTDESLGMDLDELGPEIAGELGFRDASQGVLITNVAVRGPAYDEGVSAGMVILRVDDQAVHDLAGYQAAMKNKSLDEGVLVLVGTPEGNHFVVFQR
ncbi:MAG: trypsin-like peptidase domain-containing protein [Planctomycetaceae bacterium]|nr:trypsin-like peptidase domain-containing protein [Planctomycetales bacterium]MCB9920969.1 trypsin-like peptidase domain-containing protein [Planctomycetaceae bacterium]